MRDRRLRVGPAASVLFVVLAASASAQNDCAKGDQALAASQWSSAIDAYQLCLKSNESFAVYSNMGVALTRLGRMAEAVSSYRKALELDPTNARVEFNLSVALVKSGNYSDAADHLKRLERSGNDDRYDELLAFCYYHMASYSLAARAAERVYAAHPNDAANALILGSTYTRMGQYDKALPLITIALKAAGSAEGHLIMAQTLLGMHKLAGADAELKQIAFTQPDFPGLHEARGEVYVGLNRTAEAEAEFALALQENSEDFEANYLMGRLKRFDGNINAANRYLDVADRLRPKSPEVAYERAELAIKQERFVDAVPLLEFVIKNQPDQAQAYLLLAKAYQRTGRKEEAQREGELYNMKRRESHQREEAQP